MPVLSDRFTKQYDTTRPGKDCTRLFNITVVGPLKPKPRRLDQFKGKRSSSQIAEGTNAAAANAKRLIEDAEALLKADSYASATALAILAIEEAGKISILHSIVLSRND